MTPPSRLLASLAGLGTLTLLGTLGYVQIEGYSWVDALYMTVITMSTVGFGEVQPLSATGRLFTTALIVTGVGTTLYLVGTLAEIVLEGHLRHSWHRRHMHRAIDRLSGHLIVCGYGRLGRVLIEELGLEQQPIVVIESETAREAELRRLGCPYVIGSALEDAVLQEAGVERAATLVAGTGSDSDNLFITLSARELNPALRVHVRAESETAQRRLRAAGANQVISSYQIGAQRIAASILRPSVVDFLEVARPRGGGAVDLEEVRVASYSALRGRTIRQAEGADTRLRIVALKRGEQSIELVPGGETEIQGGDHLIVIGERSELARLAQLASTEG